MKKLKFEYKKLKGRIVEKYDTREKFGEAIGLSNTSMSLKLNGQTSFSQADVIKWCKALDIDLHDVGDYFYT